MNPNQSQLLGEAAWSGFSCMKNARDQQKIKFSFVSGQDSLVMIMAFAEDAGVIILFRLFLFS